MLDYAMLPPEINSLRMYTGPGAMPLLTAAQSWTTTATSLTLAAQSWSSTISTLAAQWLGPSSWSMHSAALLYQSWLTKTAIQCEQTAAQAVSAVVAYETAFAATVPPPVVAANRALLAMLVSTNFLGINTPAIMATEADYLEMWAQDAAAMYQYTASSLQAIVLEPFAPAPQVSTPLAVTASPASGVASTSAGFVQQALGGLLDIFAPGSNQYTTGLAGLLNLISGSTGSSIGTFINDTINNTVFSSGFYSPSNWLFPFIALLQSGSNSSSQTPGGPPPPDTPYVDPNPPLNIPPYRASVGTASNIGPLSVPPAWAQPEQVRTVSIVSPISQNGENGTPGFPGVPGVPLGLRSNSRGTAAPKYGTRPTIMTRPPSGG